MAKTNDNSSKIFSQIHKTTNSNFSIGLKSNNNSCNNRKAKKNIKMNSKAKIEKIENKINKYKKMAKEDKKKLLELLEKNNITKEDIGNNIILLKEFFEGVIKSRGINYDTYMKNAFPYLVKYLKKDGYILEIQKNEENGENNLNYWKKM